MKEGATGVDCNGKTRRRRANTSDEDPKRGEISILVHCPAVRQRPSGCFTDEPIAAGILNAPPTLYPPLLLDYSFFTVSHRLY